MAIQKLQNVLCLPAVYSSDLLLLALPEDDPWGRSPGIYQPNIVVFVQMLVDETLHVSKLTAKQAAMNLLNIGDLF